MCLHSSLLPIADVLTSLGISEIILNWPDTGSYLPWLLDLATEAHCSKIHRHPIEGRLLLQLDTVFEVVQQVLYD